MAIRNEEDVTQQQSFHQQQPSQRPQQYCSACGLAPRTKPDGTVTPLKRCSRCQNAWYHDLECQRHHFPQHKHACRKAVEAAKIATTTATTTPTTAVPPLQLYYIEARPGRGSCLVADSTISLGQRVEPPLLTTIPRNESFRSSNTTTKKNNNSAGLFWSPLVPPVLHEAQRATSCAYCFRTLSFTSIPPCRFDTIKRIAQYQLLFCSSTCREAGRNAGFQEEEQAVGQLYDHSSSTRQHQQQGGPPQIFSTAILLHRILVALEREQQQQQESSFTTMSRSSSSSETVVTLRQQLDRMQSMSLDKLLSQPCTSATLNDDDGGMDDEEEEKEQRSANFHHTQAVVATVMAMLEPFRTTMKTTGQNSFRKSTSVSVEYLMDLVTKIKLNGFSISNGESVALGVGIFPTLPSSMNHSCYPNVLPTFFYGIPNQVPQLILTACQVIQPHQELCISYIDHSCPRSMRRQRLQRDYYFFCHCEACHNEDYESQLVALKCPSHPQRLKQLVSYTTTTTTTTTKAGGSISVEKLEATYQAMKDICYKHSWYVQESGERLVQSLLDQLSLNVDDPTPAYRALSVLEDLLPLTTTTSIERVPKAIQAKEDSPSSSSSVTATAINSSSSTRAPPSILPTTNNCNILRQSILTYKAAKLRLFLSPDPRQAMGELQQVHVSLSPYYPENHELMTGLRECLAQARMG
jgi:hypothetical protein